MKIDLHSLKKNLDLKKFLKELDKIIKWTNERDIYYKFIDCCATKQIPKNKISSLMDRETGPKLDELMADGKFFETISKNFKKEKSITISSYRDKEQGWEYQLINSKINKTYYVTVYQFYDHTNDSYFVTYKSKDMKDAYEEMKSLSKKPIYLMSKNKITYDEKTLEDKKKIL